MADSREVRITQETKTYSEVFINGRSVGKKEVNGETAEFLKRQAGEHGIRSFTGTINDEVITNEMVGHPIPDGARVGIYAKDARGAGKNKAAKPEAISTPEPATAQAPDGEYEDVTEQPATTGDGESGASDAQEEKAS